MAFVCSCAWMFKCLKLGCALTWSWNHNLLSKWLVGSWVNLLVLSHQTGMPHVWVPMFPNWADSWVWLFCLPRRSQETLHVCWGARKKHRFPVYWHTGREAVICGSWSGKVLHFEFMMTCSIVWLCYDWWHFPCWPFMLLLFLLFFLQKSCYSLKIAHMSMQGFAQVQSNLKDVCVVLCYSLLCF